LVGYNEGPYYVRDPRDYRRMSCNHAAKSVRDVSAATFNVWYCSCGASGILPKCTDDQNPFGSVLGDSTLKPLEEKSKNAVPEENVASSYAEDVPPPLAVHALKVQLAREAIQNPSLPRRYSPMELALKVYGRIPTLALPAEEEKK
jgi:hypothetical protein